MLSQICTFANSLNNIIATGNQMIKDFTNSNVS